MRRIELEQQPEERKHKHCFPSRQDGVTIVTEACYAGRWITLRVSQQKDGTWTCKYIIHELGPRGASTTSGQVTMNCQTRGETKAAALEAAHKEIDMGTD